MQSLEILSLCLFPDLVWPHLVQLTKAELLLKCHSYSTWSNQDNLNVGWVAFRAQLCLFNVLVPIKHQKIRTSLAPGCLQIDKEIIISKWISYPDYIKDAINVQLVWSAFTLLMMSSGTLAHSIMQYQQLFNKLLYCSLFIRRQSPRPFVGSS